MGSNRVLILGVLAVLVLTGLIGGCMYVSYSNSEVQLRNRVAAQQKANETSFDTCWKVISQVAQVAEQYKGAFKEIYPALMEGRYGNARGGALMSWITESNPDFSPKLYEKVAAAVEGQRTVFKRDQQKLIDLKREHDNLLMTIPSSWFVGGRPPVEIQVVTSAKTDATFAAGKEDDVKVFGDK